MSKIARHLVKESGAEVVLSVERHHHHADIRLKSGGVAARGHETSTDMYNSIDRCVEDRAAAEPISRKLRRRINRSRWQPCSAHAERGEESTEAPEPATSWSARAVLTPTR